MSGAEQVVLFERRGHVAVFTLNRPSAMNAVNHEVRPPRRPGGRAEPASTVTFMISGAQLHFDVGAGQIST